MGFWFTPRFCDCRRFLQAFFIRHFDFLKLPARLRAQIFHPGPQLFKAQLAQSFRREKRFKNFGSSMTFQRRKKWICESRCQVSDRLHVFGYFFCPLILPRLQFMLGVHLTPSLQSSFFILHPAYYSQSAVFIVHSVCILPLVRSLQSPVYVLHWLDW